MRTFIFAALATFITWSQAVGYNSSSSGISSVKGSLWNSYIAANRANATDNVCVSAQAGDLSSAYSISLDTTLLSNGPHTLSAQARDAVGNTATAATVSMTVNNGTPPAVQMASSVTRFGITWYFDKAYPVGQFVNGDYWVVGPVTIVDVNPRPSVAPSNEINNLGVNRFGDTGLRDNKDRRNGSMVVMSPSEAQGYDSRGTTYSASVSITFPYTLAADRSLISSISNVVVPSPQMHQALMWSSEKNGYQVMQTAAILTSLAAAPPADAFRPAYMGGNKIIYHLSQLHAERLSTLPAPANLPSFSLFERYYERPWLDHMNGSWVEQWLVPSQNQPAYGREYARIASIASLMLQTNVSQAQKQKLLIGLVQYGIDLRGIAELGGKWNKGGGVTSGRKFPIVFAGLMLGDSSFFNMPSSAIFHEDTETYYGNGWAGMKALWQMVYHHGARLPYMHLNPSQYGTYDGGWAETSERYRLCCTTKAWPGQALTTLLMGGKSLWNHDAFFDNVEDWMRKTDLYAAGRGGLPRPSEEGSSYDAFVDSMWTSYRSAVPAQADGSTNLMFSTSTGQWVANPKP